MPTKKCPPEWLSNLRLNRPNPWIEPVSVYRLRRKNRFHGIEKRRNADL